MHFTRATRANYSDCDLKNRLKPSAAMKYMQQTSSEHLESIGLSPVRLYRENMVFLLSKMCIKVHRIPRTAEEIILGTAATETRGARFVREFFIDSAGGERLVSAVSLWMLVDPVSRKILRPKSFPHALPFQASALGGAIDDVRLPKPPETGARTSRDVCVAYSHLDTNGHVNNSVYADLVCDALPFDRLVESNLDTLVISFQSEARHGDKLNITTYELVEKQFYLAGKRDGNDCFEALAIFS